jgi:hypothetical protein
MWPGIHAGALTADHNGLTAVRPIGRHGPDGAVAVPTVVPVRKCTDPAAGLVRAAEGPPRVVQPIVGRAELGMENQRRAPAFTDSLPQTGRAHQVRQRFEGFPARPGPGTPPCGSRRRSPGRGTSTPPARWWAVRGCASSRADSPPRAFNVAPALAPGAVGPSRGGGDWPWAWTTR